ncbi:C2 and transmembrane domain-containing protein [Acrasis kona]|uniref:C2 and transmembrane domain-containing protein n=1 Tax=Acrasis kona TaxID=1008807 RepID=A0AAW2Z5U6_9EUKA
MSKLLVKLFNGVDLDPKDFSGTSDPYVIVRLGNQQGKSKTVMKNLNPVWNESYTFDVTNMSDVLTFNVIDYDYLSSDDPMGNIGILLSTIPKNQPQALNLPLSNCKGGSLNVEISFLDALPPGMRTNTYVAQPVPNKNWQASLELQVQQIQRQIVAMQQRVDSSLKNVNNSAKEDLRKALKSLLSQINSLECYSKKLSVLSERYLEDPVEVQRTLQDLLVVAKTIVQVATILNNIATFVFPFTPLAPMTPLLMTASGILRSVQAALNNTTPQQVAITAVELSNCAITIHNCFNELLSAIQLFSQQVIRADANGNVKYTISYQ